MTASSHGRTRLAETGVALGIGLLMNLLLYSAAEARVGVSVPLIADLASVSGAMGGLVAAMVHFAAVALVPPSEGRSENARRAALEGLFSIIVGAIVAHYLAVPLASGIPFIPTSSAPVVGFGIGVFAWQCAGGIIGGAKLAASPKRVARALLGALSKWAGPGDES